MPRRITLFSGRILTRSTLESRIAEILSDDARGSVCNTGDERLRQELTRSFGESQMRDISPGALSGMKMRIRTKLGLRGMRPGPTKGRKLNIVGPRRTWDAESGTMVKRRRARRSLSRFTSERSKTGRLSLLARDHAAVVEGRTVYVSSVRDPLDVKNAFVSGHNNPKIGKWVEKGEWENFPIFTLTLEERRTCSRDCHHWRSCMGNNMHLSQRLKHGPVLEARLERDLAMLQAQYPRGFVVRLHVLGDFYDFAYVNKWEHWLGKFPALRVFGYTARLPGTTLGNELSYMQYHYWDRFAVRFSRPTPVRGYGEAITVPDVEAAEALGATVCPAQLHQTATCGTCTLCWSMPQLTIAFLHHGRKPGRKGGRKPNVSR